MKNRLKKNGYTIRLICPALLAAASFLFPAGMFTRWAAFAVLIYILPVLWKQLSPSVFKSRVLGNTRFKDFIKALWPFIAVTAALAIALGPVTFGEMPVSQDHVNHYFATHVLVDEMIPSFRFFGWTDSIQTGYPYGDLYPTLSYLVPGILHLVTFSVVDLSTSYAFGIFLAFLIPALAVTAWARRLAGSTAAVFAGLLMVLDKGGDREGGWIYSMFHGVWLQNLGVGLWLFALLCLVRLAEKPTTRRLAAASLLVGFSLFAHPMSSLAMPLAGFLLLVVLVLIRENTNDLDAPKGAIPVMSALIFGGIIGLAWVLRMMLSSDAVYAYPSDWKPIAELTATFLKGGPFAHQLVFVSGLSLLGAIWLIRSGGRLKTFAVILTAAFFILGSMDLIVGSDLGLAGGAVSLIQYQRFSIPAKPLWYSLAGAGLSVIISAFKTMSIKRDDTSARRMILAVFLAPLVFGVISALPGLVESPVASPLTLRRTQDAESVKAVKRILDKERTHCENKHCKALYFEKPGHGGLYPVLAVADAGYEWQSTLSLPANNFVLQNPTGDFEVMAGLGVSVVISKWKQENRRLEEIGTFGKHYVYRVKDPVLERASMQGAGKVSVVLSKAEKRVFRVTQTEDDSVLVLTMPPYRKWHAEQNGRPLTIEPVYLNGLALLGIKGLKDGEIKLEYKDSIIETCISIVASILILGCLALLFLKPRVLPGVSLFQRFEQSRWITAGIVFVFVIGVIAVFKEGNAAANREWLDSEPTGTEVEAVLHRQGPLSVRHYPKNQCLKPYVRNPDWSCANSDMDTYLAPAKRRGGKIPSCLSIGIPESGYAVVAFAVPSSTTEIKGRFQSQSGKGSITGTLKLGNSREFKTVPIGTAGNRDQKFSIPILPNTDRITFSFKSEKKSRVCLEAVALSNQ